MGIVASYRQISGRFTLQQQGDNKRLGTECEASGSNTPGDVVQLNIRLLSILS
jgi:hypothetical protein